MTELIGRLNPGRPNLMKRLISIIKQYTLVSILLCVNQENISNHTVALAKNNHLKHAVMQSSEHAVLSNPR